MSWLDIVKLVVPLVLAKTKVKAIAPYVAPAIESAENLKNAKGAEKLQHATDFAINAANAANAQLGHEVIDPALVGDSVSKSIGVAVDVANIIHKAQNS